MKVDKRLIAKFSSDVIESLVASARATNGGFGDVLYLSNEDYVYMVAITSTEVAAFPLPTKPEEYTEY